MKSSHSGLQIHFNHYLKLIRRILSTFFKLIWFEAQLTLSWSWSAINTFINLPNNQGIVSIIVLQRLSHCPILFMRSWACLMTELQNIADIYLKMLELSLWCEVAASVAGWPQCRSHQCQDTQHCTQLLSGHQTVKMWAGGALTIITVT